MWYSFISHAAKKILSKANKNPPHSVLLVKAIISDGALFIESGIKFAWFHEKLLSIQQEPKVNKQLYTFS